MFTVLLSPAVPRAPRIHSGVPQSHFKSPDTSRSLMKIYIQKGFETKFGTVWLWVLNDQFCVFIANTRAKAVVSTV